MKIVFASLTFITSTLVFASTNSYDIRIQIQGLPKDSICYLANYYGDKQYIQDTAKADTNGKLVFNGSKKLKEGMYLLVMPGKKYFDFLIDDTQNFSLETDTADFVKNVRVKGSGENKLFFEYLNYIGPKQREVALMQEQIKKIADNKDSIQLLKTKITKLDKSVKDYVQVYIKKNSKTLWAKILQAMTDPVLPDVPILPNGRIDSTFAFRYMHEHYWDNFDFSDERLLVTPVLYSRMKNFMNNLNYQVPDSINKAADMLIAKARASKEVFKYVVYWLTYNYETSQIMGMDAVFVHIVEKFYVTKETFWVDSTQNAKICQRAAILKPLLLGKYAPNLTLKDTSMHDVTLYDIPADYTIVYFWDYNCSHCKKTTPVLLNWYDKVKTKHIQVYSVQTETDSKEWKNYIKENKLDWINVYDPYRISNMRTVYDIYSTPVIYLLDENKKILAKRVDVEQLESIVERSIKQKIADREHK